ILNRKFDVREEDVIKMHKMLMKDIDVRAGYKQLPNVIQSMGREIRTTKPENVKKEMDFLISWYNDNKGVIHPLELTTIFHGKFEKIHPFEDGNGRVGRFLVNIILIKNGYPPIIIRKSVRNAYMSSLQAFDNGHEDKMKRFIIEKYKDTFEKFFEIYVKYV
ncbi:MAG: Fic family protein, partial [Candidatus Aenigmarchaeota archaeon]|nr:Fic family protein [Candidatus Aenigmarchaeota archaeon]